MLPIQGKKVDAPITGRSVLFFFAPLVGAENKYRKVPNKCRWERFENELALHSVAPYLTRVSINHCPGLGEPRAACAKARGRTRYVGGELSAVYATL